MMMREFVHFQDLPSLLDEANVHPSAIVLMLEGHPIPAAWRTLVQVFMGKLMCKVRFDVWKLFRHASSLATYERCALTQQAVGLGPFVCGSPIASNSQEETASSNIQRERLQSGLASLFGNKAKMDVANTR